MTRIEVVDTTVEFSNDPEFVVFKLDISTVLGRVRIFGDGRASLLEYQNKKGWQEYELRLEARELEHLVREVIKGGVLNYDSDAVRAKLENSNRPRPVSSHSTQATLTLRLTQVTRRSFGIVTVAYDIDHRFTLRDLTSIPRHREYYEEAPELLALAGVIQDLLDLRARPGLRLIPVVPPDPSSIPSWASSKEATDRSPQILYFGTNPRGVWTVNWLGGDRRQLTTQNIRIAYDQPPSISPDHRLISWRGVGGLHITDLETGQTRKFVEAAKGSHSAVWSPSGDVVALSADIGSLRYHLFAVDPDGTNPRTLTDVGARPLQWSRDGEWIYYRDLTSRKRGNDIYLVNRDGNERRPVLPTASGSFRVSPDGRMGAYVAVLTPGEERGAWLCTTVLDAATGTAIKRRSPTLIAQGVSGFDWSPDSSHLVFTAGRTLGAARADGTESTILVDIDMGSQAPLHANWSPDGRAIVFVRVARTGGYVLPGGPEIWVVGQDGSDPRKVAAGLYPHWFSESTPPVWVPW